MHRTIGAVFEQPPTPKPFVTKGFEQTLEGALAKL